ncbi:MAG: hypothetical protein ACOYMN_10305 [Roseimicrobium sp.]
MIEQIKGFHGARAVDALVFFDKGLEIIPLKRNAGPPVMECPHVVEWSFEQKCFHVQSLADSLRCNLDSFLENRPTSYMQIALCRSHSEASAVCGTLQGIRDQREGSQTEPETEGEQDED